MFFGLPDPDPDLLVRGMDPDPSIIVQIKKKNHIFLIYDIVKVYFSVFRIQIGIHVFFGLLDPDQVWIWIRIWLWIRLWILIRILISSKIRRKIVFCDSYGLFIFEK
jgi:hypothetical protein